MQEAKRRLWPALNEASRNAVYNVCVVMEYEYERDGCDGLATHTDTKPTHASDLPKMPYVEGAGVLVVSTGMSQILYTREITSDLYKKPESVSPLEIPALELVDGGAYYWPAGEAGSTDWMSKHRVGVHPDARPGQRRLAFVFRAIKPEHAREYKLSYPYCMVEPSRKRGSDGRTPDECAGPRPAVWK